MSIQYYVTSPNGFYVDEFFEEVKYTVFPGGEVHVKDMPRDLSRGMNHLIFKAKIESSEDAMVLFMATDAAQRQGFTDIQLVMPYVPYARQDRVANPGEAHSLKVFATMVNMQKYTSVTVYDPHSDVVEALFDNLIIVNNHEFVKSVIPPNKGFYLVVPDAGAQKKATALCASLAHTDEHSDFKVILANKIRNTRTGQITEFTTDLKEDQILDDTKDCYIVDDICDGGGTFLGLAKALKENGAGDIHLVVTHGIFSNNAIKRLTKTYFKSVKCSNRWSNNKE